MMANCGTAAAERHFAHTAPLDGAPRGNEEEACMDDDDADSRGKSMANGEAITLQLPTASP
jgi:hypothetical protein